ncbi:MAG: DUF4157 domain-containing protein [Thiofilum sp.]
MKANQHISKPAATASPAVVSPAAKGRVTPQQQVLGLQRRVGNQAVGRLLQRKLKIGSPNDRYEQEADRIAEQVMAIPQPLTTERAPVQVQRFSGGGGDAGMDVPASVEQTLARPGRALDAGIREEMEARFGHDFSAVRVHTDTQAAQSAADVNARAYTVGNHIVFGTHESLFDRNLLSHELTHSVQQNLFLLRKKSYSDPKAPVESMENCLEYAEFMHKNDSSKSIEDYKKIWKEKRSQQPYSDSGLDFTCENKSYSKKQNNKEVNSSTMHQENQSADEEMGVAMSEFFQNIKIENGQPSWKIVDAAYHVQEESSSSDKSKQSFLYAEADASVVGITAETGAVKHESATRVSENVYAQETLTLAHASAELGCSRGGCGASIGANAGSYEAGVAFEPFQDVPFAVTGKAKVAIGLELGAKFGATNEVKLGPFAASITFGQSALPKNSPLVSSGNPNDYPIYLLLPAGAMSKSLLPLQYFPQKSFDYRGTHFIEATTAYKDLLSMPRNKRIIIISSNDWSKLNWLQIEKDVKH